MKKVAVSLAVLAVVFVAVSSQAQNVLVASDFKEIKASSTAGGNVVGNLLVNDSSYWKSVGFVHTNRGEWVGPDYVPTPEETAAGWVNGGGWMYQGGYYDYSNPSFWRPSGDGTPSLTFLFNEKQILDSVEITNLTTGAQYGVAKLDVYVMYAADGEFVKFGDTVSFKKNQGADDPNIWTVDLNSPDIINFGGVAIYGVEFRITQNQCYLTGYEGGYGGYQGGNLGIFWVDYGDDALGFCRNSSAYDVYASSTVGLNYIQFNVSDVPEPATMSLLALGGLALLRRKR